MVSYYAWVWSPISVSPRFESVLQNICRPPFVDVINTLQWAIHHRDFVASRGMTITQLQCACTSSFEVSTKIPNGSDCWLLSQDMARVGVSTNGSRTKNPIILQWATRTQAMHGSLHEALALWHFTASVVIGHQWSLQCLSHLQCKAASFFWKVINVVEKLWKSQFSTFAEPHPPHLWVWICVTKASEVPRPVQSKQVGKPQPEIPDELGLLL